MVTQNLSPMRLSPTLIPSLALIAFCGAVGVSPPTANGQTPPRPDPLVRENTTVKVTDHVYVIPDGDVNRVPNVGIVVGQRATLVIETGMGPRNGAVVVREAQKVARSTAWFLAATHFHPEHSSGAIAFPADTVIIRSAGLQKDIDEFSAEIVKDWSRQSPVWAALLVGADWRKANTVFEKEYSVDLGGVRVRMIALGPNHTRGDTAFLVQPDGVLFPGETVLFNGRVPAMNSPYSSVANWLASLDVIEGLHPKLVVPSHFKTGDVSAFASVVARDRAFLQTIQRRVADLKKSGENADAVARIVIAEVHPEYSQDDGLTERVARAAFNETP